MKLLFLIVKLPPFLLYLRLAFSKSCKKIAFTHFTLGILCYFLFLFQTKNIRVTWTVYCHLKAYNKRREDNIQGSSSRNLQQAHPARRVETLESFVENKKHWGVVLAGYILKTNWKEVSMVDCCEEKFKN